MCHFRSLGKLYWKKMGYNGFCGQDVAGTVVLPRETVDCPSATEWGQKIEPSK